MRLSTAHRPSSTICRHQCSIWIATPRSRTARAVIDNEPAASSFPAALLQLIITLSAIGLWMAAEKVMGRLYRRLLLSGIRQTGHGLLNVAGKSLLVITLGSLLVSLLLLVVHAFAGPWRFPANLPDAWTTQHWQSVGPVLLTPLRSTLLLALVTTLLAVVLVVAALEHESRQARAPTRLLWAIYRPLLVPQVAFLYGLTLLLEQLRWLQVVHVARLQCGHCCRQPFPCWVLHWP